MALDHTRDYFHYDSFFYDPTDLSKTTVLLFFTRWITHFCAPVFVLLAGTSVFLSGQRKTKKELSVFLLKRGIWLVLLELTVLNFAWFFNPAFSYFGLQVIWALGISMICLSVLVYLPRNYILLIGFILVAGHNLLDNFHVTGDSWQAFLWAELHERRRFSFQHTFISTSYPVIPWIGLMAFGYCLGSIFTEQFGRIKRKKFLLYLGISAILLFILIRSPNIYGDLAHWSGQPTFVFSILSFINVTKYPPSLDYLLVTAGAGLLFLYFAEKPLNRFTKIIAIYGRVPFFFYLIHIYFIHLAALLAAMLTGFNWRDMTFLDIMVSRSEHLKGYGFNLGLVYLFWIILVIIMYPLCKWYDRYKTSHKEKWWLSYL